jgi:homoserine O-acetyltransferase
MTANPRPEADYQVYGLGDVRLQSGAVLPDAQLAFKTYGRLNDAGDNAVVIPTYYTGKHSFNEPYFGPGRALDPDRHFIVSPDLFGNGLSSSPSNTAEPFDGPRFPRTTLHDNVACQHRLLTEVLGVRRVALVMGWSMAAMQSYQWAAQYPDMVANILPFCGSARCSPHNFVFLDGVRVALQADCAWQGGDYDAPPEVGLRAFGRIYAGWAFSQTFFREGHYRTLGYETVEDLLVDWEEDQLNWDANDLLAKLWTWQNGDISDNALYGGELERALGAIEARAIVMPCSMDLYFPPEDNAIEVAAMKKAELRVFDSPFGHCIARPGGHADFMAFLDQAIDDLLSGG